MVVVGSATIHLLHCREQSRAILVGLVSWCPAVWVKSSTIPSRCLLEHMLIIYLVCAPLPSPLSPCS